MILRHILTLREYQIEYPGYHNLFSDITGNIREYRIAVACRLFSDTASNLSREEEYIWKCVRISMRENISHYYGTFIHTYTHTYMHMHEHEHIHTHTHARARARARTRTHTHTHTLLTYFLSNQNSRPY